ncbi:substrate-binding periplasmic protein [Sneathiella limimaris]|uniref:substrate-binding periplasmic protein n=1 Tax=Sneathiella limimaris TaxID=1964213 RepID=UPI0019D027CF|nr:transporter substrate-binding domain-containing protein [Sneathiella limimaris]
MLNKILFLQLFAVFLSSLSVADEHELKFACTQFPPFKIQDSETPGIDVERISTIIDRLGLQAEYTFFPWARAYEEVKTGRQDALCGCSYQRERTEFFYFSDEFGTHAQGFLTSPGSAISDDFEQGKSLDEYSLAVVRGYQLSNELEGLVPNVVRVKDDLQAITLFQQGRVDAVFGYIDVMRHIIQKHNLDIPIDFHTIERRPYYICFHKNEKNHDLLHRFNDEIRQSKADGSFEKINRKYLGN